MSKLKKNLKLNLASSPACEDPASCSVKFSARSGFTRDPEGSPIGYVPKVISTGYKYNAKNPNNMRVLEARTVPPISSLGPPSSVKGVRKVWTYNLNESGNQGWRTPPPQLADKQEGKEVKAGPVEKQKQKEFLKLNGPPRSQWNGFGGRRTRKCKKIRKSRKIRKSK